MTTRQQRGRDGEEPHQGRATGRDAAAAADRLPPDRAGHLAHPSGLWVLFITEMWERFSYYGMRALLVLYLIASTSETLKDGTANENPGFGWSKDDASILYGFYNGAVYLTPLVGGWLADRFLGTHRSMLIGGWIIAAGHLTLAATEFFGITAGQAVALETGPGALLCFLTGLVLIVVGTGFFKPCVSVMVGQLYGEGDPRRDSGFTIFYMGINLGAFISPLVAGTLGEKVGWHWGFGSAAVGMIAGLIFYQILRPAYLAGIGLPPSRSEDERPHGRNEEARDPGRDDDSAPRLTGVEWQRLAVIVILAFVGNIVFWAAFEQAGSSMNIFAKEETHRPFWLPDWFRRFCADPGYPVPWWIVLCGGLLLFAPLVAVFNIRRWRRFRTVAFAMLVAILGGAIVTLAIMKALGRLTALAQVSEFPASWYQSVNPLSILVFAPVFSWLWVWLTRRRANPSTPMKFALGLYLLGLAFLAMVAAAFEARGPELASPHWLLITYVVYTWGELCLSPVGLSMVTKLAPVRLQSLMMGVWFLSFALSNLLGGLLAAFSTRMDTSRHVVELKPDHSYAEVRFDARRREISVSILAGDEESPLPIDARSIAFDAAFRDGSRRDGQRELTMSAVPQKGEDAGRSSRFVIAGEVVPPEVDDIEDITGILHVPIGNERLQAKLAHDHYTFVFEGLAGFYLMLVVFPIGTGLFLTLLSPLLRRMMHGVQ